MKNPFKRFFCKHEKTEYVRTMLEPWGHGYTTSHVWRCKECGKENIGGKRHG